jgi:hypothetical protein
MIDFRLITDEELDFLINAQMKDNSFKQGGLSRSGLIDFIESIKDNNPKNMNFDSYYIIKEHIERLKQFKETQINQINQFKEILTR